MLIGFCAQLSAQEAQEAVSREAVSQETAAVTALEGLLAQTRTFSAEVEQLLIDQDGRELQETRALLLMEKPARFRWAVTEPYEELTVTDGETLWHYEPDLGQVTIQRFEDEEADRRPVMLLNGNAESIRESYDVSSTNMGGDLMRFILIPRNTDRLFERLSLTFKGPVLEEMQFEDSLGQQTSLTFSEVNRNVPLEASNFSFTPPTGIDIIDTRD
jgi:outer membrane lipoprotein carrier protein